MEVGGGGVAPTSLIPGGKLAQRNTHGQFIHLAQQSAYYYLAYYYLACCLIVSRDGLMDLLETWNYCSGGAGIAQVSVMVGRQVTHAQLG